MTICLIDTSVFCNILRVPNRDQQHQNVMRQLRQYVNTRVTLLLPLTTIIETGNHIAQQGDGGTRRKVATIFVQQVQAALDGEAPWTPTLLDLRTLRDYLTEFPDSAMRGMGLGDLAILKELERQCSLHHARRVFIWSLDQHLSIYDRKL